MGELCALHADAERNTVTQFHTLAREAESCIYYYAAGLVARTEAGNLNGDLSRSKFH
jgi:hypothetical protein